MPWLLKGLRDGVVTTGYPRRPDEYASSFPAAIVPHAGPAADEGLARICPTGAISVSDGVASVDRGRCILCLRCVASHPEVFELRPGSEVARLEREELVVAEEPDERELPAMRRALAERVSAFGRSVHVRHIDCGSDGSDEWELQALWNPVYDVQRLGVYLTASPRHADVLVVTGCGAHGMEAALRQTYDAMPDPKVVMALGTDAISGGMLEPTYANRGGVLGSVPVDVLVPGAPASPFSILHGLLLVLGRLSPTADRR